MAAASSPAPTSFRVYLPAGTLMRSSSIVAFASWIAARSVHTGGTAAVAHVPSIDASGASVVLFTLKVAGAAYAAATWVDQKDRENHAWGLHERAPFVVVVIVGSGR